MRAPASIGWSDFHFSLLVSAFEFQQYGISTSGRSQLSSSSSYFSSLGDLCLFCAGVLNCGLLTSIRANKLIDNICQEEEEIHNNYFSFETNLSFIAKKKLSGEKNNVAVSKLVSFVISCCNSVTTVR